MCGVPASRKGCISTQNCCYCWQKKRCNYMWAMLFSFPAPYPSLTYGTVSLFPGIHSKSSLSTPNTLKVKAGQKLFLKGDLPMRSGLGFRTSEWELPTETKWGSKHSSSLGRAETVEVMCCNPKTCSLVLNISSVSLKLPSQTPLNFLFAEKRGNFVTETNILLPHPLTSKLLCHVFLTAML